MVPSPQALRSVLRDRAFGDRRASCVGLGACRAPGDEAPRVIATALAHGCTVLDTAPHYHRGAHERAIGEAIRLADAACPRASLVVCTKVGYVPELREPTRTTLGCARLKAFVERRYVVPRVFAWDELAHSDHTFAPAFVRASVVRSLEALGLTELDCVFLEAPELQQDVTSAAGFLRRVAGACEALEQLCAERCVRAYGLSTNADLDPATFLAIARGVAGQGHHFRAVRAPFSLLRRDAAGAKVLARAAALGLYTIAAGCLDGGAPAYDLHGPLGGEFGEVPDAVAALRWASSAPFVQTALFGSRDPRHVRANLAAAATDPLPARLYEREAARGAA